MGPRNPSCWFELPAGVLAVAVAVHVSGPSSAQEARTTEDRAAGRLIRQLELPVRRAAAARDLLRLGDAAVPAISRALSDPRPEVVCRLVLALRILGARAKRAVPALRAILADAERDGDPKLVAAARYGLAPFHPSGTVLLTDFGKSSLIEKDRNGKTQLTIGGLKGLWGGTKLPDGNYLVSLCSQGCVREIDARGKVLWETKTPRIPIAAQRLPSDHVLIVDAQPGQIIEVDRAGKIVWRCVAKHPSGAVRLPSGNTLISDYKGQAVFEVDGTGREVWRLEQNGGPMDIDRLHNGNNLICLYSGKTVTEIDAKGKVAWKIDFGSLVECAYRSPSGLTWVGGAGFVRAYDPKGKEVEQWKVGRVTGIELY